MRIHLSRPAIPLRIVSIGHLILPPGRVYRVVRSDPVSAPGWTTTHFATLFLPNGGPFLAGDPTYSKSTVPGRVRRCPTPPDNRTPYCEPGAFGGHWLKPNSPGFPDFHSRSAIHF